MQPFETEARLSNISEFTPYRKESAILLRYKHQVVSAGVENLFMLEGRINLAVIK
jgi:hypothetical protein